MAYYLDFTDKAKTDIAVHNKNGNKIILKKIYVLLNELIEDPFRGTGKPEPLKYSLSGCWSRRINKEHRIVYEVDNERIIIHSVKGHY